jgi:hypothetical protein
MRWQKLWPEAQGIAVYYSQAGKPNPVLSLIYNGDSMTRRLLTATAIFFVSSLIVPNIGHAQTFKVEKFDIKGDGGRP